MAFNTVHATGDSLSFDAFYRDEFGVANTSTNIRDPGVTGRIGIHKNRFTGVTTGSGSVTEFPKNTAQITFRNQANPHNNATLVPAYRQTQIPGPPFPDEHRAQMFFSDSAIDAVTKGNPTTIATTILYAVGSELNRHGIRSYVEKSPSPKAIILVPGTEPPRDPARWGIAISDTEIKALIKKQFNKDVPYDVNVLAGFSTGGCGLHQTMLHNLINLNNVKRVVYFDCLYEMQCTATPASKALKAFKSKSAQSKIIVYQTSEGGNDYVSGSLYTRLTVPTANPMFFDNRGIITNLFQQTNYIGVVCFRSLEAAAKDGIIAIPKSMDKAFKDMEAALAAIPRGSFISNRIAYDFIFGTGTAKPPTGKVFFEDWAKGNQAILTAFAKQLGIVAKVDTVRYLLWKNMLPGWPGGDGEEKHDLLIPEFGWEFLI